MWKSVWLLCCLCASVVRVGAQSTEQDSVYFKQTTGIVNIGVIWGFNKGSVTESGGTHALESAWLNVPVVKLGYEYEMKNKWGINSSFGIGLQPFKYMPDFENAEISASEVEFSMPYGILSIGLKKRNDAGTYLGFGGGVHINTQKTFRSTITISSNESGLTDTVRLERDLFEYAGVQHEFYAMIGHKIQKGGLRGLDMFIIGSLLNREKLTVNYTVSRGTNFSSGKIRYSGGYFGVGIRFYFLPSIENDASL